MNYDPNIMFGVHTVKVTLQQWEYKSDMIVLVGGNCKGSSVITTAMDLSEQGEEGIIENNCHFAVIDEADDDGNYWFNCILYNADGDDMQVEDELDSLPNYIVGAEIINLVEDKDEYNDCEDDK